MSEPLASFGDVVGIASDCSELTYRQIMSMMDSESWYDSCSRWYASLVEPSIDGMLGGLAYVHEDDVAWSVEKLKQLAESGIIQTGSCLDCGGGIGRVSHFTLKPVFCNVDMVEGCELFVQTSRVNFAKNSIRNRYNLNLQDRELLAQQMDDKRYDVVYLQWVIGHLTDRDVLEFLRFARDRLLVPQTGCIIMKENCIIDGGFFLDRDDMNLIRNLDMIRELCVQAKLRILEIASQPTWPANLYPIRLIVLSQQ